jgi:hypothetical protein
MMILSLFPHYQAHLLIFFCSKSRSFIALKIFCQIIHFILFFIMSIAFQIHYLQFSSLILLLSVPSDPLCTIYFYYFFNFLLWNGNRQKMKNYKQSHISITIPYFQSYILQMILSDFGNNAF